MNDALAIYVGLLLARVGAFIAVMPPFAARTPRSVRAALVVAITAFYLGTAPPTWDSEFSQQVANAHPLLYGLALIREAFIGAAMGFMFALFLLPARIAGEFITQQMGLNAAMLPSPSGQDPSGALTQIFETLAALLFLVIDGHHIVIALLHASFLKLPLGGSAVPQAAPMLAGLSSAYEMGLLLAGPIALCLFLLAVLLAVMARTAPQLNVYSVGFTLQVTVALVGGLFLMPEMVRYMLVALGQTGEMIGKSMN